MHASTLIPLLVTVALAIATPALVMYSISRGGWAKVAEAYPETGTPPPAVTNVGYGVFNGWVGYKGCLIIGVDDAGLHLRCWPFVLGWFHDPICVPWKDVGTARAVKIMWAGYHELRFAKTPDTRFALRDGTFEALRPAFAKAGVVVE